MQPVESVCITEMSTHWRILCFSFLQDLSVWKDKHQLVSDTVSFLIATCEDQVAVDLKDKFVSINTRWENLFPVSLFCSLYFTVVKLFIQFFYYELLIFAFRFNIYSEDKILCGSVSYNIQFIIVVCYYNETIIGSECMVLVKQVRNFMYFGMMMTNKNTKEPIGSNMVLSSKDSH